MGFHGRRWHLVLRQRKLKVCFIPFAHASIENLASHNVTVAASKGCRKAWLESAYAGRDGSPA